MALDANAKKTEHNGAKNGDKRGKRADVKRASRKRRRRNDSELTIDARGVKRGTASYVSAMAHAQAAMEKSIVVNARLFEAQNEPKP